MHTGLEDDPAQLGLLLAAVYTVASLAQLAVLALQIPALLLAVSFGISPLAVYALGPLVKAAGFSSLLQAMALIACCTAGCVLLLPADPPKAGKTIIGKTGD